MQLTLNFSRTISTKIINLLLKYATMWIVCSTFYGDICSEMSWKRKWVTNGWNLKLWQLETKTLFSNIRWGFCIATHCLSLKHILISVRGKNPASCDLAGTCLWGTRLSLVGKFLARTESGWQAPTVDKQPLVGRVHILSCQYCDRRDAEWHCHQCCQRPVTFAPVVWEWWRRAKEGRKDG